VVCGTLSGQHSKSILSNSKYRLQVQH
jgi:hypothetical protein